MSTAQKEINSSPGGGDARQPGGANGHGAFGGQGHPTNHEPRSVDAANRDDSRRLSDRVMTCAACSHTMLVTGLDNRLPFHRAEDGVIVQPGISARLEEMCEGSRTRAYPHRFLPESKPLKIEMLPDDDDAKLGALRNTVAITECAKFLCAWLADGMRIDNLLMSKIIAHTTNARRGAENFLRL